ncbi:MAG: SDR family oxidoreductase [Chloroflexi bacterium]|nr:SDR family oxidoreductase [Chloroflexota bacterium]
MSTQNKPLSGQTILITGGARRLGREIAISVATAGADIVLHYAHSSQPAEDTANQIRKLGQKVKLYQADFSSQEETQIFCESIFSSEPITSLINNAAIFRNLDLQNTTLEDWNEHLQVNLTSPFQLSRNFALHFKGPFPGKIINILDWRALHPGKDHFPYTVSKAALAAMTRSLAISLAPNILVNAIALGAILAPEEEAPNPEILNNIPMLRWAKIEELGDLVNFFLSGPLYMIGEIIHLDGGRHLN